MSKSLPSYFDYQML